MHHDHLPPRGENEIGAAWQAPLVQTVAVAKLMQRVANGHLRLRVPATYTRHKPAAPCWGQPVHDVSKKAIDKLPMIL